MAKYYHAHQINRDRCRGHMRCMRHCPTQAIRVRGGKAVISEELCVDCGSCLSVCPSGAIEPITDPIGQVSRFRYRVVVPSPVLYSQFDPSIHPYIIHLAFKQLGFDEVVDVTTSAAELAVALDKFMKAYGGRLPLISSYCPCILRLIQVKYPDLVELVVPLDVPREVTAREIRRSFPGRLGLKPEDIGVLYIATCPAKIVSTKQPAEKVQSWFDGVVSTRDVYSALLPHVIAIKQQFHETQVPEDFVFDTGWARMGSIARAARTEKWLAVAGLDHVVRILDDIENSRLRNVSFVEVLAHMLGCVSGPFNVENPYVARTNSIKQRQLYEKGIRVDEKEIARKLEEGYFFFESPLLPRLTTYFDTDLETSIKRMKERDRVYQNLPQIDCGCCGAPTCMAFAEDHVRGEAQLIDCKLLSQKSRGGE
jgi:iron only hydrogenase large subunit-like protein